MTDQQAPYFYIEYDDDDTYWLYARNAGFDENRRARLTDIEKQGFDALAYPSDEAQAFLADIWTKRSVEWLKQERRDLSRLGFGRKITWTVQPDVEEQYQGNE